MKALVQRVRSASVQVGGDVVASIGKGFLVLLGVAVGDTAAEADYFAEKTANLRVFEDASGKMSLSLLNVGGAALVVSQFTLYGDCSKGRRPDFTDAARPELARPLYELYASSLASAGVNVSTGVFAAEMLVRIENDGPVTIILERNAGGATARHQMPPDLGMLQT